MFADTQSNQNQRDFIFGTKSSSRTVLSWPSRHV